jgi:glycosyltransferase involved in cell wall biosynthesis/SAM-dependent methyltransferase/GT2 family glycosyltransferase
MGAPERVGGALPGDTEGRMLAAVLVPVLDEARHLERALRTMSAQELDGDLEILVIDGGSTDASRDIVARLSREDARIRLLDNPAGRTPNALNIGLRASSGTYVVRMDAHALYPRDYIARGIERLERGDVACASGPQVAVGDQPTAVAVARALQSPLGVGGARFRRADGPERDVDSGFCGVWRRDLLIELGGWDEDWPVNQDAELAARIRARGGRIVCVPEMAAQYLTRSSLRALARQYWRYGQYRAKTARRHPGGLRRSHVLPPALVGLVAAAALPTRRGRPLRRGVALYATALLAEGRRMARRDATARAGVRVTAALATMHLSWGAGFLEGCRRFGAPWRALVALARDPTVDAEPHRTGELRIGYVVSRFPALSETFVLRELVEIDRRPGVRCDLLSLFPEAAEPVHPAAREWVARRRRASSAGAIGALAYWAARRPLRLTAVLSAVIRDYARRPLVLGRALVAVACALQHARTLRTDPVDHLHAHFATYPALAAWTCSRMAGIPYSFTAHAHDVFVHRMGLRRRIDDAAFCVGISQHNARILRDAAPGRGSDVHVVHCGIAPELYAMRPRAPRAGAPIRVACVAALKDYKGHRVLLDAVGRLARDGHAVHVDLVGDGPLRGELERQVARLDLVDRVRFLGALTEPEVAGVVDGADVFVLASRIQGDGDTDGIPVALMEAMASGLPVVASDVSGVPELVRHGETGLLAPVDDDVALADALRSVVLDPDAAIARARAARALVEERFAVAREASRLLELIRAGTRHDDERLAREASFHDVAFAAHTRSSTWKFYDAGRDAYDRYDELLDGMAHPGSRVLEYGCGPGGRAFHLAQRGADVLGIDISPVAIDIARETARERGVLERTTFAVMDAEALELPADSFELVCGTSILHHLDIDRAYREVARVLRPSGRAVFLEPLGHNPLFNAYRRLTPGVRTPDEHPLRLADLDAAGACFGGLTLEHFSLLSPAAAAVHGQASFERMASALRRADQRVFATVPALRRWSWTVVMVLSRPVVPADAGRASGAPDRRTSAVR